MHPPHKKNVRPHPPVAKPIEQGWQPFNVLSKTKSQTENHLKGLQRRRKIKNIHSN